MIELPQGQLYLVRPLSPKGYACLSPARAYPLANTSQSELLYKDCVARIRRTGQDYQYQLVIQRAYEEGEELEEDAEDEDEEIAALSGDRDEKTFLLDVDLHFRSEVRDGHEMVLAWRDLSGDVGDLYEFVCDNAIDESQVATFELIAKQCQYERKYRRSHQQATDEDLEAFSFDDQLIPQASPLQSPITNISPPRTMPSSTQHTKKSTANVSSKRDDSTLR